MNSITEFKNDYAFEKMIIDNHEINYYYRNIDAKNTLVFLPGTSGKSLTYYKIIQDLEEPFNIIAIDYPKISNIDDLVRTLEKFIDAFHLTDISLVGNSFGNLIIQLLVSNRPNVYNNIFLINPTTKTVDVNPEDIQGHIKSYKKQLHVLNGIFPFLYKSSYKRNIKVMVYNSSIKDKKKWYKFYMDLFKETNRELSIAIYECLLDFWQSKDFLKSDFSDFTNKVYLFKSEINLSQSKSEFNMVSKLFPHVEPVELPDNRNLTLIKHAKIISNTINQSFNN